MFLRLTRARFDLAHYDESVMIAQETAGVIARLPGFVRYQSGSDRATGAAIVLSAWDTKEHAGFSRDVLGELIPRIQAAGMHLEPPEIYGVVVER